MNDMKISPKLHGWLDFRVEIVNTGAMNPEGQNRTTTLPLLHRDTSTFTCDIHMR